MPQAQGLIQKLKLGDSEMVPKDLCFFFFWTKEIEISDVHSNEVKINFNF